MHILTFIKNIYTDVYVIMYKEGFGLLTSCKLSSVIREKSDPKNGQES